MKILKISFIHHDITINSIENYPCFSLLFNFASYTWHCQHFSINKSIIIQFLCVLCLFRKHSPKWFKLIEIKRNNIVFQIEHMAISFYWNMFSIPCHEKCIRQTGNSPHLNQTTTLLNARKETNLSDTFYGRSWW